jgi:hypothetical protein
MEKKKTGCLGFKFRKYLLEVQFIWPIFYSMYSLLYLSKICALWAFLLLFFRIRVLGKFLQWVLPKGYCAIFSCFGSCTFELLIYPGGDSLQLWPATAAWFLGPKVSA